MENSNGNVESIVSELGKLISKKEAVAHISITVRMKTGLTYIYDSMNDETATPLKR